MAATFTAQTEAKQTERGRQDARAGVEFGRNDESTSYGVNRHICREAYRKGWEEVRNPPKPETFKLGKTSHTFPNSRAAVDALAKYLAEWSGYLQFEINALHSGGERAFDGFEVRVKDFDGFGVAYIVPAE